VKIKMRVTAGGSPDGVTVNEYEAGVTYDVPRDLADTMVKYGLAENWQATVPAPRSRAKKATAPPENK
jgi:hypothetical protein